MNNDTVVQDTTGEHYIAQAQILYRSLSKSIARYIESVEASLDEDDVPQGNKER